MENRYVSKDEFIDYIENIKNVMDYQSSLNKIFGKYDVDGYLYQPDCTVQLLSLLHKIFSVSDRDEYISKFCFDSDFGRKKKDTAFIGKTGEKLEITNSGELYDLLVSINE